MVRRLIRRLFVLGLLISSAQVPVWVLGASSLEHECSDHVCFCRALGSRAAARNLRSCHGATESRAECSMRGACRHDAAPPLAGRPVYLLPGVLAAERLRPSDLTLSPSAPAPSPGYGRTDSPPPRFL